MEVISGAICIIGLTVALAQTHLPAYLLGILLSCAWSCLLLELKKIDEEILENELGWKLRRDCSSGVYCLLLLPCAVLLTTFRDTEQLKDDFSKILIIMSVVAVLVPLAILSYTLLLTTKKQEGATKTGTSKEDENIPDKKDEKRDKEKKTEKERKEEKEENSVEKTKKHKLKSKRQKSTSESKSDETVKTSSNSQKDSSKDSLLTKRCPESKDSAVKSAEPKDSAVKSAEPKDSAVKSAEPKDSAVKSAERKDSAVKSAEPKDSAVKSAERKDSAVKSAVPKDTVQKSTESKDTGSKNTEKKESASKSTESKDTGLKSSDVKHPATFSTQAIHLEKNVPTVLNVCHLIVVVAIMLFMMMVSLRTVGFKATVLLGMHGLLLSILLTTLPVVAPRSFSLGEASVIAQALTYFQLLLSSQLWYRFDWLKIDSKQLAIISDVTAFTEVALLSCVLVVVVLLFWPGWRSSAGVYLLVPAVAALFSLPSLYTILRTDFVSWVMAYVSSDVTKRYLFVYWALASMLAVMCVYFNMSYLRQQHEASKPTFHLPAKIRNRIRATQRNQPAGPCDGSQAPGSPSECTTWPGAVTSAVRKQFHVLAVCVFVPGILLDPPLTMCAWTCALIVFVMLECLRIVEVYPWHGVLNDSLRVFLDGRDEGPVILTPIYLLTGCTLPLWLFHGQGVHIVLLSGVLSLGIGDTAASVVGTKFGTHKWPDSPKSIEGTLANILSQLAFLWLLVFTGYAPAFCWPVVGAAVVASALVEAFTRQIDNLVLPLFLYCLTVLH